MYLKELEQIIARISTDIVDFNVDREKGRKPTQVSSNFITNKEQGDWAEGVLFEAINEFDEKFVAVKYGKSDEIIAGDEQFDEFYENYQIELDTIGKRPDLLIYRTEDFDKELGYDISKVPHEEINEYVKKAIAGIEVRSSAFLVDKYNQVMALRQSQRVSRALNIRDTILNNPMYNEILSKDRKKSKYLDILQSITDENLDIIDFKTPTWRSDSNLVEIKNLLKELNDIIKELHKRTYLSITPKVEDLKVVYKWIENYQVPHYYFQVFFDKIYGISFKSILELLTDSQKEDTVFSVESDSKNQNKTTIKIDSSYGLEIAAKVDEPSHKSVRKELARGRLLFYVSFEGGKAYLNIKNFRECLGVDENGL